MNKPHPETANQKARMVEAGLVETDRTVTIGRSRIQHGKASDRVYLMEAAEPDMPGLLTTIEHLAGQHHYGKIFAKVPARWRRECTAAGFQVEAEVPGFFRGKESGLFLGKYLNRERGMPADGEQIAAVLTGCRTSPKGRQRPGEAKGAPNSKMARAEENPAEAYRLRLCTPADCPAMATLFRRIFPTYPFPVQDPRFLEQSMAEEVSYAGAWYQGQLVALASAEYSAPAAHAEMTDFATAPEHRRRQLAARLLVTLEEEMQTRGIKLAYTIARAVSYGINLTFARAGYRYAGTLINNTQICGRIESMNIWYRQLS
jgi:beta-lysine N6-acetyltransferase